MRRLWCMWRQNLVSLLWSHGSVPCNNHPPKPHICSHLLAVQRASWSAKSKKNKTALPPSTSRFVLPCASSLVGHTSYFKHICSFFGLFVLVPNQKHTPRKMGLEILQIHSVCMHTFCSIHTPRGNYCMPRCLSCCMWMSVWTNKWCIWREVSPSYSQKRSLLWSCVRWTQMPFLLFDCLHSIWMPFVLHTYR